MVVASFGVLWLAPASYLVVMSLMPLYFAVVTGVLHRIVVRAAYRDARVFIKTFLTSTVVTLLVHLAVLSLYMFTHVPQAKLFALAFAVGYVVYLVFETMQLVAFVRKGKDK